MIATRRLTFDFLRIGEHSRKPRTTGLTIVVDGMDSGFLSVAEVQALGDFAAPYVDYAKLGWMITRLCDADRVRAKIEAYHAVGIKVFIGGMALEIAALQGQVDRFIDAAGELGVDGLEVSSSSAYLAMPKRFALAKRVKQAGLVAFVEIGRKGDAPDPTVDEVKRYLARLDDAGGDGIIIESERLEAMHEHHSLDAFLDGCAMLDAAKLIFELPYGLPLPAVQPFASRIVAAAGPEANLANVELRHVLGIETVRTGTCFGPLFGLLPTDEG